MIFLTISSLFISSISRVFPLYLSTAILLFILFILSHITDEKNHSIVLILNYAFLTISYFFAIFIDVLQKTPTATTICVLLVALPLIFIDRPFREFFFYTFISLLFNLEVIFIKKIPTFSIDILNSISFLIVGQFLGYNYNKIMLKNIINNKLLENQRDTDTLTALYNKGAIENKAVNFLQKMDVTASMLVIDLDDFKKVNDNYGHSVGDEILVKVGKVLLSLFRSSDLISRFGGDEFIVFLPMTENKEILKKKAEQILDGVSKIRIEQDPNYRPHICIGIATYPHDGDNYENLFKNADSAMYKVKHNGKNGYNFFD